MHLFPLIQDLAVILSLAGVVSFVFQKIRQPLVLGYLIAGIIAGPNTPPFSFVVDVSGIQTWAELGIIFLMFQVGLEFNYRRLKHVGLTAAAIATIEVVLMIAIGFLAGKLAGWAPVDCFFLGSMLSISSTTIIIKSLDELKLAGKKLSELIVGILIAEDILGVVLLVILSTMATKQIIFGAEFLWILGKLLLILVACLIVGYLIVPRVIDFIGRHSGNETLIIISLGLCLGLVTLSSKLHYSSALGAFLMGSTLAESKSVRRIVTLVTPLRDVFVAIFFVSTGMLLNPSDIVSHWQAILMVTGITLIGKILTGTLGSLIARERLRESLQVGFCLAQIGEFSFIIADLGLFWGVMKPALFPIAVSVSIITVFTTPFLIRMSQRTLQKGT